MLKSLFPFPIGYQDHTDATLPFSKTIDLLAIGAGVSVIEKHITLDRSEKGIDYQAALEPKELRDFVQMIRMAELAMGSKRMLPLGENDMQYRQFQKKSIVAIRDLEAGEVLKREDIAFMRAPNLGILPSEVDIIIGKTLARPVVKNELLLTGYFDAD